LGLTVAGMSERERRCAKGTLVRQLASEAYVGEGSTGIV
jgi:hypothetical protein